MFIYSSYDWFFTVLIYSDVFYFIFTWSFCFLFLDFIGSYLRYFFTNFFVLVDSYFVKFLLNDMDSLWDLKGGSKYNFLFLFSILNYFSLIFYQFTWLHFSIVFDLFSLFIFMWPLFFSYFSSFFIEYGLSFTTFIIGNSWIRVWYFSDLIEWFTHYCPRFLRLFFGDLLFSKFISISIFSFIWPFLYFYIMLISFIYLIYIPLACFVRYVSVFTALSVLWNVWVTSSFFILTNGLGFYTSLVVIPSWFFFCVLFLSFEGTYVLIHITLLIMLYIKITSVVLLHKKSSFISYNYKTNYSNSYFKI
jgi:hypothetical protein